MIRLKPMTSREKKALSQMMIEQFGASIEGEFMINKEGKVFLVTPDIRLISLGELNAEGVGLYIGTIERDGLRLTIEGSQLLKAKKNVIELSEKEAREWVRGFKLEHKSEVKGYVITKYAEGSLGSGKSNGEIIQNYTPKPRRIRRL